MLQVNEQHILLTSIETDTAHKGDVYT